MKTRNVIVVDVSEWDDFVVLNYGKPYSFQQQNGCRERGTFELTIPFELDEEPEISLDEWLATDVSSKSSFDWYRGFYPHVQSVANDLFEKGLLVAGEYMIIIDW